MNEKLLDDIAALPPQGELVPGQARPAGIRLYFDLRDKQHTLPDVEGVEVSNIAQAKRVALELVRKLQQEDASAPQDWSGWTLNVVDAAGVVVFSIDLDSGVR